MDYAQLNVLGHIIVAVWKGHNYKQIKVGNESWWTWTLDGLKLKKLKLYYNTGELVNDDTVNKHCTIVINLYYMYI